MNDDLNPGNVPQPPAEEPSLEQEDAGSILDATRQLFVGECYSVSDLRQVGNPIVFVSDGLVKLSGYPSSLAVGRNLGFLQRNDTDQQGNEEIREALRDGRSCTVVMRNYRQDGTLFWNEQRHYPIRDREQHITHLVTVQRDVSATVHAEAAQAVGQDLSSTLEGDGSYFSYAMLFEDDGSHRVCWVSEASRVVSGFEPEELVAGGLELLVDPEDAEAFRSRLRGLHKQERRSDQYRLRTKDGRVLWVEDFGARSWSSREAGVTAVYGVVRDVSDSRRQGGELWQLAHFDALTGLPNRHLLEDRIQQALFQARRSRTALALAFVDLDNFRFVNEAMNHRQGDRLIQEVGLRLRRALRRTDTLARWNGDRFAVLLADLPQARAVLPVLDKILASVSEPFRDGGTTMRLSASLGVDLYPDGARSASELIEHAESALKHAKEHDRGRYRFFEVSFDEAMRRRTGLENDVRRAITEDQLVLHYQPRVELETGTITSVEALVRWLHPGRGLLKPAEFLPMVDEAQLGSTLFSWVLDRACAQAKRWQQQRTPRRVAINVSPQALVVDDFTMQIQTALSRFDLHPALLEIEINERTGSDVLEAADHRLREVRAMGVHVALDDFGVAYSSLAQLRGMPLDGLKIDRSFVGGIDGSAAGEHVALVRAIVALGKSLGLTVTAEGIETREQNTVLRSMQCDQGQGYLFSQAVPAEYVPAFA